MVVKPLAFDEKHLKFFTLFLVQPFPNYLAFINFQNLILSFISSSQKSFPNGSFLFCWTD